MSRIGKKPVVLPAGLKVDLKEKTLVVEGPKGKMSIEVDSRISIENNCELEDLTLEQWKECSDLIEDDILSEISSRACVNARKTIGGPAPEMVDNQISELKKFCKNIKK